MTSRQETEEQEQAEKTPIGRGAQRVQVKVPGKMMLAGEYAVLAGHPALATTLDCHLTVRANRPGVKSSTSASAYLATPKGILVTSDLWSQESHILDPKHPLLGYLVFPETGEIRARYAGPRQKDTDPFVGKGIEEGFFAPPSSSLSESVYDGLQFTPKPAHQPLVQTVLRGARLFGISQGSVHVSSELDVRYGLGSSSALYLGVLAALAELAWPNLTPQSPLNFEASLPTPVNSKESDQAWDVQSLITKLPPWSIKDLPLGHLGPEKASFRAAFAQTPKSALQWALARLAFSIQWENQKRGSGYDILTQLVGGVVRSQPFELAYTIEDMVASSSSLSPTAMHLGDLALWSPPPRVHETLEKWPVNVEIPRIACNRLGDFIHIFVGGKGAPTGPLVRSTMGWMEEESQKGFFSTLCQWDARLQASLLNFLTYESFDQGLCHQVSQALGHHRRWIKKMPQYPLGLAQALEALPGLDKTWSFKTTGAGGEDALFVWGELSELSEVSRVLRTLGWKRLAVGFDRFGLRVIREKGPEQQGESSGLRLKSTLRSNQPRP